MKTVDEFSMSSPLVWAYMGDAVYEQFIREYLISTTDLNPHKLHKEATKFVKAKAQAEILKKLDIYLTEEEKNIVRRGRNTQTHSAPKHADATDYMYATAFEALIGYLYLTKHEDRLNEILELCVKI